jgi:hypothetical protein
LDTFSAWAALPLAASSHSDVSFAFSSVVRSGAALTLDLQAATAFWTAGLLAMLETALLLVDALLDDDVAGDVLDVELLLLPQPVTNAALSAAIAISQLALLLIKPPHSDSRIDQVDDTWDPGLGGTRTVAVVGGADRRASDDVVCGV